MPAPSSSSRAARRASAAPTPGGRSPPTPRAPRERERLARARLADDDRDAVAVGVSRRTISPARRRATAAARARARPPRPRASRTSRAAALDRVVEDPPLEREQLRRRVRSARAATVGIDAAVRAPQRRSRRSPLGEHDRARRREELVGEALDVARSQTSALAGSCSQQRLHHVAPRERRALLASARSGRRADRRSRSTSSRVSGATARVRRAALRRRSRVEPELRRALAPLRHELLRRDAVVLAAPGRERRDLRSGGARCAAPLELGLDLGAPAAERPQHRRRDAGDVGDAVAHRRPLDAELAREQRRAAAPRRGSRPSWRARRCGARRASTTARRRRASGWRRARACAAAGRRRATCGAGTRPRRARCPAIACTPPGPRRVTAACALDVAERVQRPRGRARRGARRAARRRRCRRAR